MEKNDLKPITDIMDFAINKLACIYKPSGWENYPKKEYLTDCGLKVVNLNEEAWNGERIVKTPLSGNCMKCKRTIKIECE